MEMYGFDVIIYAPTCTHTHRTLLYMFIVAASLHSCQCAFLSNIYFLVILQLSYNTDIWVI